MVAVHTQHSKGRDFTAEELIGRRIRIEGPVPKKSLPPIGISMMVIADGEMVGNVLKIVLTIEPNNIVKATLTRFHSRQPTEEITLRDDIEVSFSAIVSEAQ